MDHYNRRKVYLCTGLVSRFPGTMFTKMEGRKEGKEGCHGWKEEEVKGEETDGEGLDESKRRRMKDDEMKEEKRRERKTVGKRYDRKHEEETRGSKEVKIGQDGEKRKR